MTDQWDDGTTHRAELSDLHQLRIARAHVEVLSGPDSGARMELGPNRCVVGSGPDCDLRVQDDLVSRRHVEFRAQADGVRVVDLESKNGTVLGAIRVRDVVLQREADISIGNTSLGLRLIQDAMELPLSPRTRFGRAVGVSAEMRHVFALLEQAAARDITVLLEGDSGTGKDVLAVSLHEASARRDRPFVVVDCGAIPENLIESELFGHERGAFTGADRAREGAFEQARGGSVFLDEIGELPIELQPKLLRAVENRSFRRLGGGREIDIDVRLIAATNRGLADAVRRGEFRKDLFYRIAVFPVNVPPLADRPEDIVPLARMFYERFTGQTSLPEELAQLLTSYAWPGNARELRNVIERFATLGRADPKLLFGAVPNTGAEREPWNVERLASLPYHEAKREVVDAFHRAVLPVAIDGAGSVSAAADRLGIPRSSLQRMLKNLGR